MQAVRGPKDASVETIRGLALVLMVAGHVVGSTADLGMRVAQDSALRYFYDALADVRMPLFTAISGFVYAMRPLRPEASLQRFMAGKCRRILLPMLTVGTLFFIAQMLAPHANSAAGWADFPRLQLFGYMHFWFLQAIFWIFLVVAVLDVSGQLKRPAQLWAVGAVALACSLNREHFPGLMSLDGAAWLFVFFLAGLGLYRFADALVSKGKNRCVGVALLLLVLGSQSEQLGWIALGPLADLALGTFLGLSAVYVLIVHRFRWPALAWLGQHSYEVYLFHLFGTAATRIALARIGVHDAWIVFPVSLLVGLLWPIVLKKSVAGIQALNLFLFGARPRAAD